MRLSLMAPTYCTTDRDHTLNNRLKQMLFQRDFDVQCMGAITCSLSFSVSLSLSLFARQCLAHSFVKSKTIGSMKMKYGRRRVPGQSKKERVSEY